jgi:hypothetical protein
MVDYRPNDIVRLLGRSAEHVHNKHQTADLHLVASSFSLWSALICCERGLCTVKRVALWKFIFSDFPI